MQQVVFLLLILIFSPLTFDILRNLLQVSLGSSYLERSGFLD